MKAVILAGGKGTRLAPYTSVFPKPMLPIGEKPILDIVIKQLAFYGFKEIILSVGYLAELIEAYFHNNENIPEGVRLTFVRENTPLGTAGSLSLIPPPKEPFLVINGDTLTTLDYSELMEYHKRNGGTVTISLHERTVNIDFGVIKAGEDGRLIRYDEKPTLEYAVSMGIYVFDPKVLELIAPNQRLDLPDLIKMLLAKKEKVQCFTFKDFWLDIGRHDDYEMAVESFEKMRGKLLRERRKDD